jgi:glutamate racemase
MTQDTAEMTKSGPTIAVFDSGFGGLTVLRKLLLIIPGAHYIYLGDTARLPYGSKSQKTIARYAVESALFLAAKGADHLVIACNTASALALDDIRDAVSIPVTGVIQPGAESAWTSLTIHRNAEIHHPQDYLHPSRREVLVLATQATVASHAYHRACSALGLRTVEKACPLLVPLIEEGWIDHPVTREVIRIYLREAIGDGDPSAVLLGCTHYPLIEDAIRDALRELGCIAGVIDSAHSVAFSVAQSLGHTPAQWPPLQPSSATFECYATDSIEKFQRLGSAFLGQPLPQVHLIDLGG